jgi:hypothetical protein
MTTEKSDSMSNEIYNELNLKSTEELLEIWKTNDRSVWSDAGFKAIKKILIERQGSVPPQQAAPAEDEPDSGTYYDIDKISSISTIANVLAWVILVGDAIALIAYLFLGTQSNSVNLFKYLTSMSNVMNLLIWCVVYILPGLFFFVVLRVLSESIYVLVEIAENSRSH